MPGLHCSSDNPMPHVGELDVANKPRFMLTPGKGINLKGL